jgi:hypothetical protein
MKESAKCESNGQPSPEEHETGKIVPAPTRNKFYTEEILPLNLVHRQAMGRWIPVNHAVAEHAYFEGLPTNRFMGGVYQNVCAEKTIIGLGQKPVVSSFLATLRVPPVSGRAHYESAYVAPAAEFLEQP